VDGTQANREGRSMPRRIRDSVVVITGASSGIGRATAQAFAAQGATVVLAARNGEALREVRRECNSRGGRALMVPTDVCGEAQVRALAETTLRNFGRIDVWVNNAAVSLFGRIEDVPSEDYEKVLRTNVFGYVYGARAVIPVFREQGSGVLINVSSVVGSVGQPFTSAYVTSKWAIRGLGESLRMELQDAPGIHVCTVMPGTIDTPLFQHAANFSGRAVKAMEPVYPPEAVANTILSLADSPKREVFVGNAARAIAAGHGLSAGMMEKIMARRTDRKHFQERIAAPTHGNLFQPMKDSMRGGWASGSQTEAALRRVSGAMSNNTGKLVAAGAVLAAALPLGMLAWRRVQQSRQPW
ncbi:MAG: SDR family oxidoreductase, partial [Rhodospirillales bacterium]|nr:SDR family oxidoreductase [Rhodospirillales bacterium]